MFFITFLRALAAGLITNSHYSGVYPTDLIANGGLIGDILFFAVSGYCLYQIRLPFFRWYGKRIYRIYLPTILVTAFYLLIHAYDFSENGFLWWFAYPTYYHFVGSIIVLYIPYYFCMTIEKLKENIPICMIGIAVVWLLIYCTVYDRSTYHIDTVREPMIRFLYMESMLLGAWFRQNDDLYRNRYRKWTPFAVLGSFFVYFAGKLLFTKVPSLARFQCLNQVTIFILLYFLFLTFMGLDARLEALPEKIKKLIRLIADMTLEIYLVQYVLIDVISPIGRFPLNWILITSSILAAAFALHFLCRILYTLIDGFGRKFSRKRAKT